MLNQLYIYFFMYWYFIINIFVWNYTANGKRFLFINSLL